MKTSKKICPFYNKGCKFGKKCKLSHDGPNAQQQKVIICKLYKEGRCTYGQSCKFPHEGPTNAPSINTDQQEELELLKKISSQKIEQQMQSQQQQPETQQQQQQKKHKQSTDSSHSNGKKNKKKSSEQLQQQQDLEEEEKEDTNNEDKKFRNADLRFTDLTKTEEGKIQFSKNMKEIFKEDFMEYFRSLNNLKDKDFAQFQRKFLSSFKWVNRKIGHNEEENEDKSFQIKFSPNIKRNEISNIDFDIKEGFIWFEITIPGDFPESPAVFSVLNSSFPSFFKNCFQDVVQYYHKNKFQHSFMKTFKFLDNNIDEFFLQAQEIKDLRQEQEDEAQKIQQKKIEKQLEKEAKEPWSQQEQQFLEEALKQYKNIVNKEEKWHKISEFVETKNIHQCLTRFQFCKTQALNKQKQAQQNEEESSEDDDEEEEKDQYEDSDSEYEDDGYQNVKKSSQDYHDEDSEQEEEEDDQIQLQQQTQTRENQFGVEFNIISTLKDLNMSGIALCRILDCVVSVQCKFCKFPSELTVKDFYSKNNDEVLVNNMICVNCNHTSSLLIQRQFVHPYGETIIAKIGSASWDILDILNMSFELNCKDCNQVCPIKKYVSGEKKLEKCRSCFQSYSFQYFGIQIQRQVNTYESKYKKQDDEEEEKDGVKNLQYKKKIGIFKLGQALPNNGACPHYKNSFRYFRFPCCGKAYPCDNCHSNGEARDHESEYAKSMICGFCGKEQALKSNCVKCNSKLTKIAKKGGHWENGEGVRNQTLMSNKDSKKHRGQNKTLSNKKKSKK